MQFPLSKMVMKACKGKLGQDVGTTIKSGRNLVSGGFGRKEKETEES